MDKRRTFSSDEGFSLVELLVAVVLAGVVGGIVLTAISSGLRSQVGTTARLDAVEELQVAIQRTSRDLRVARSIVFSNTVPASEQIGTNISRDGENSLAVYRLVTDLDSGEEFLEQIQRAGTDQAVTRRLVTQVSNTADGIDLLEYYDADGNGPLTCSGTVAECRPVFLTASSVVLTLARSVEGSDEPIIVSTTVSIRSIRYGSDPA